MYVRFNNYILFMLYAAKYEFLNVCGNYCKKLVF
jgi:hypothetical protein